MRDPTPMMSCIDPWNLWGAPGSTMGVKEGVPSATIATGTPARIIKLLNSPTNPSMISPEHPWMRPSDRRSNEKVLELEVFSWVNHPQM